jgi:hypothetical protein
MACEQGIPVRSHLLHSHVLSPMSIESVVPILNLEIFFTRRYGIACVRPLSYLVNLFPKFWTNRTLPHFSRFFSFAIVSCHQLSLNVF